MAFATSVNYRIPTLRPQLWGRAVDNYVQLDSGDDRWPMTGIESVTMGCPTITARPEYPCQELQWGTPEGFPTTAKSLPFRIEEAITCSVQGAWSPDELEEWALREARAVYSAALARQVWAGIYTVSTPAGGAFPQMTESTLASEADDVSAAGTTALDAVAAVEYGLGQRLLGQGMVHMTVDVLTRAVAAGAVKMVDGVYYTPSGHIVVADYGYFNDGSGSSFVYGSGIVYYETTEWNVTTGWNPTHNDLIVRVSAYATVMFDACPVVKATVTSVTAANFGGV